MIGNYEIVTLCGSTKFKDDFLRVQKELTLKGKIVISVGLFGHSGDDEVWTDGTKEMLDDMHKRKIDMADCIYVINKNHYIGASTKSEIAYAHAIGKPVYYMEMTNEEMLTAIELWNNSNCFHPLTCGNDSCRKTIFGHMENDKVVLKCDCGYVQTNIPDAIYKHYKSLSIWPEKVLKD